MRDSCGRTIDYLRISITDRCNLRCAFCMPPEGIEKVSPGEILSYEEIVRLARLAACLGISKLKITGGEPLVRKGAVDLARMLKTVHGIENVTLTTNGVLLDRYAEALFQAGLDAVNISLHANDPVTYESITGFASFNETVRGLSRAIGVGLRTKINCVILEDVGVDRYTALAELARDRAVDVRFIEMMPIGRGGDFHCVSGDVLLDAFEKKFGPSIVINESRGNGPASYRRFPGFNGCIGFIDGMSHEFCESCNRVRLTSMGELKPCLFARSSISLRDMLRSGADDEAIRESMRIAIARKPARHFYCDEARKMVEIGG